MGSYNLVKLVCVVLTLDIIVFERNTFYGHINGSENFACSVLLCKFDTIFYFERK